MIFKNGKKLTPAIGSAGLLKIMMNGSQLWPELSKEIPLSDTKAGDILLWDKTGVRKLFVSSDALSSYPSDIYTPIGIVVIPASHDVYGDGSCGVMSLKPMNCDTPSTGGTSEQSMHWGVYGTDISELSNLNQVPTGNTSNGIPTGQTSNAYLPSDKFSSTQCAHDTDTFYSRNISDFIPSPYLTDGSRNPGYYQTTSPSSSSNALADFDGIGNTEKIITQRGTKNYNSWTPGRTTEADYPAASCCDMFHTEGTSQGDWYLPACGELGYIMPHFNKINKSISNMRQVYGSSVGVELGTYNGYWLSTECSSGNARNMYMGNGYIQDRDKNNNFYVRAFLKVSPLDMSGISPEQATNGTYVYANNGKLYSKEQWDTSNNENALGVAVVTENCKFVVNKELPMSYGIPWSDALHGTDVDGLINYSTSQEAMTDYSGKSNTDIIRNAAPEEDSSNNAAHYCYAQTLNGQNGYLPSAGELAAMYNNKSEINQSLVLIGSKSIDDRCNEFHTMLVPYLWSSTSYTRSYAYRLDWSDSHISMSYDVKGGAESSCYTFPIFPL